MRKDKTERLLQEHGFTLVELMIAMVISGFVMAALYSTYVVQQKHALAQEQVAEMQQNLRAGMNYLIREIRLAGFDPTGETEDDEKIVAATAESFQYFFDNDDENSFILQDSNNENELHQVIHGSSPQPVAEDIEAIEFFYVLEDGTETTAPSTSELDKIRSVQVSMLARAGREDRKFTNGATYVPASGNANWDINGDNAGTGNPANDHFRRRLLITSVQLRNMGLAHE